VKAILATYYGAKIPVLVDDDDFDFINKFGWHVDSKGYARCKKDGKGTFMARLIMKVTDPQIFVDHINGNSLDNRKCNIRLSSNSQNQANRQNHPLNKSGYRGVCWAKDTKKWQASIKVNCRSIYLGQFINIEDAADAYKKAAEHYFGEFSEHRKAA
jgi:hypothetical protein